MTSASSTPCRRDECRSSGMTFSESLGGNEGGGVLGSAVRLRGTGAERRRSPNTTASAPKFAAFSIIFSRLESALNHQLSTVKTAIWTYGRVGACSRISTVLVWGVKVSLDNMRTSTLAQPGRIVASKRAGMKVTTWRRPGPARCQDSEADHILKAVIESPAPIVASLACSILLKD